MADIAVLLSIQPKYCELIASGEKTIEVRKTRPNIDPPFKCLIYCTKSKVLTDRLWILEEDFRKLYYDLSAVTCSADEGLGANIGNGKVIGEFICDNIFWTVRTGYMGSGMRPTYNIGPNLAAACLTYDELENYGKGRPLFGWHISELKIYDRPKELSEFRKCGADSIDGLEDGLCKYCKDAMRGEMATYGTPNGSVMCEGRFCGKAYETYLDEEFSLTRPPQSWCYVEERR